MRGLLVSTAIVATLLAGTACAPETPHRAVGDSPSAPGTSVTLSGAMMLPLRTSATSARFILRVPADGTVPGAAALVALSMDEATRLFDVTGRAITDGDLSTADGPAYLRALTEPVLRGDVYVEAASEPTSQGLIATQLRPAEREQLAPAGLFDVSMVAGPVDDGVYDATGTLGIAADPSPGALPVWTITSERQFTSQSIKYWASADFSSGPALLDTSDGPIPMTDVNRVVQATGGKLVRMRLDKRGGRITAVRGTVIGDANSTILTDR